MALKVEFTNDPFTKPDFFTRDNKNKTIYQSSVPQLIIDYLAHLDDSGLEKVREYMNSMVDVMVDKDVSNSKERPHTTAHKSDEHVTFFRYYRRLDDKTGEICNKSGVTVRYTLDFATRTIYASTAICNGDNFRKDIGREYAEACPYLFQFPMPDEMTEDNCLYHQLVNALVKMLSTDSIRSAAARRFSKRLLHELLNV